MNVYFHHNNKQQGIALIQVLLITAILSVLALYLTSTAKNQVKMAQWASDKSEALVALHSAEAELLFTVLTESKTVVANNANSSQIDIVNNWNFFSTPFVINNKVIVKIQDQSALIHAHFPDEKLLKSLMIFKGVSSNAANALFDNLLDWQDLDNIPRAFGYEGETNVSIRNGAVPNILDFSFVNGVNANILQTLVKNTTLYKKRFFNPMNANEELLSAITNSQISKQVIQLREQKQLTSANFSQLTGIVENDKVTFFTSNRMAITLKAKIGQSVVEKKLIVEVAPYANKFQTPITFYSNQS